MPTSRAERADFAETMVIHVALRGALKQRSFGESPALRKVAERLLSDLESERSIYGRQLKMLRMLRDGATIEDIERKVGCSRRTVFRYLNHLEAAGLDLALEDSKYRVSGRLLSSLLK